MIDMFPDSRTWFRVAIVECQGFPHFISGAKFEKDSRERNRTFSEVIDDTRLLN
jgi:hypothetical protein